MERIERQLVERDTQLRVLDSLYADAERGEGWVVSLDGPVSSGKSTLLQEVSNRARKRGAVVLNAVASRAEHGLPLGVIGQLLHGMALSAETSGLVEELLDEGARRQWDDLGADPVEQVSARVLNTLCMAMLEHAQDAPLVICVDDGDHADAPSVYWLACLFRRLRGARVLVVVTRSRCLEPAYPYHRAELLSNLRFRSLDVDLLTRSAVSLLMQRVPNVPAHRAAECHAITGGNPLLVGALIEDYRRSGADPAGPLPAGTAYGQATLACLYRSEPVVADVARALAVLGEWLSAPTVGRMLRLDPDTVAGAIRLLAGTGVLNESGAYRHARSRSAVLADMTTARRGEMHRLVAELLHGKAPALVVAHHIVRADRLLAPWVPQALHEAAAQALTEGDVDEARTCLRAALVAEPDPRQQAEIRLQLARLEWQVNPAAVLPLLPELMTAVRTGALTQQAAVTPVTYLLWHGRVQEATGMLSLLCAIPVPRPEALAALRISLLWLAYTFPDQIERAREYWRLLDRTSGQPAPALPPPKAASVLTAIVSLSPYGDAVAAAERIGCGGAPDLNSLGPTGVVMAAMIVADRLTSSGTRSLPPLSSGTTTWQGLHALSQAEVAMGVGDPTSARHYGQQALAMLSPNGLGVALGSALASVIWASTGTDAYDDAARQLDVPIPPGTLATPFGVRYLRARGCYYLATDRARAAASDFQACGGLVTAWGMDDSATLPWRTDLAQAVLPLGRRRQSRELANEQLRRVGDGDPKARAVALRVLAAAGDPTKRVELLREAVALVQARDDRLEAVRALADLGDALHEIGESNRARMVVRTARTIADRSKAGPVRHQHEPVPTSTAPAMVIHDLPGLTELSEAERKVAALAALGHTNREIAGKLYVTVSTVEQHLTRVYRKLRVNGRGGLPSHLDVAGIA